MTDNEKRLLQKIYHFFEMDREMYGAAYLNDNKTNSLLSNGQPSGMKRTDSRDPNPDQKDKQPFANKRSIPPSISNTDRQEPAQTTGTSDLTKPSDASGNLLADCKTLDELQTLCRNVSELETDLQNTRLVFGTGNPNADLMLIGEAPGEQEDREGEPFVGAAGQLLTKILSAINFTREDVYIANILKHRPPGNRNPSPEERKRSLPYLLRQIDLVEPKLILCLGKVAGNTLLANELSLMEMRGNYYPFRGAELTVTYHPAALLRNPEWKRPVWEDVQELRKRYNGLGCKP